MGCSLTEGVGCYDYSINTENTIYWNLPKSKYLVTKIRFHKLGWPNRVGKKLGYDKVINLGSGGSSNSAHLKLFVDKILPEIDTLRSEYDINIIWMMTEPSRFSFYTDERIMYYSPSNTSPSGNSFAAQYIKEMPELEIGPLREQIFLMRTAEQMFKNLRVNFLFTSWVSSFIKLYKFVKTPHFLSPSPYYINLPYSKKNISKICGHPNESGYEIIANEIVNKIKEFHPHLDTGLSRDRIEWIWKGHRDYTM